jgi:hypothetical protein
MVPKKRRVSMRSRMEFLIAAILIAAGWGLAQADGPGYKCGFNGMQNCQQVNCYDAGKEGYSCALVTPINHKTCDFTGELTDNCVSSNQACAKVAYYVGGTCDNNNAPFCDGIYSGVSKNLSESGCP